MNHATFKASLFMAAGIIDHEAGTRDIRRLSGLYRLMPVTATLATVACAAMAGVPLLNGFISKEMFFTEAILATTPLPLLGELLPYAATLAAMFAVAYSLRFIHGAFFGPPPTDLPRTPHEPPRWMRFPVELLVLVCLLVGILPALMLGSILDTAVRAILGASTPAYDLAVWHGFNLAVLMSVIALVGGVAIYIGLQRYLATAPNGPPLLRALSGPRIFERIVVALSWRWARALETLLGTRRLQPQLRALAGTAILAAALPLAGHGLAAGARAATALDPALALVWLVGGACALGAAWQAKYHRLAALILMGGAGVATCLTFVWFSAPDLALTQLLVEVVTTVLMLLGLRWLPKRIARDDESTTLPARLRRGADLLVALGAGAGVAALAYAAMTRPSPDSIARFFTEQALPAGGGRNVVNVILVDFRGFDTLGEISVLAVVAITVYALLRRFRPAPESIEVPEQQRVQNAFDEVRPDRSHGDSVAEYLLVPAALMRLTFPPMLAVALFLFLRGHDLPGGGFIAGLTVAIALIVQYMANGTRWVEARLRIHPLRWMALGLLLAVLTGAGAWLAGHPFLTSHMFHLDLPGLGRVPLASALFFDLGVFALVVGATALILIALAHQSVRSHRAPRAPQPATEA
jgi:multicomponent K+:H+ antiporter subunit A